MNDFEHSGAKEGAIPFGEPDAEDPNPANRKRYFGKYRGSVVTNIDPLGQGRIIVRVPDVFGFFPTNWAMPCVPLAGPNMGTSFVPPPVGTSVWVEFEQGDPQMPIWVGCFWDPPLTQGTMALLTGKSPAPSVTLETVTAGIGISDLPILPVLANVSLFAAKGATTISLSATGVTINAPSVTIKTALFTVNGTALTVTGP
jgi:hypothetical protein